MPSGGSVAIPTLAQLSSSPSTVSPDRGATAAANGANLAAAYTAAAALTPNGSPLSATNRAAVVLQPGVYTLTGNPSPIPGLDCTNDFIDIPAAQSGTVLINQSGSGNLGPVVRARCASIISGCQIQTPWGVVKPNGSGQPSQWWLNAGHNWPGTANDFPTTKAGLVPAIFDRADNCRNASGNVTAGSLWNTLMLDPQGTTAATDAVIWSKPIGYAPVNPVTAQISLNAAANSGNAAPAVNDVLSISFLDAAGNAIVTCAMTFADQTSAAAASATASIKLSSNQDSTGTTHANFFTKNAAGAAIQFLLSVRLNPATQTAALQLGHDANGADSGDGVRAYEHEDVLGGMNGNVTGTAAPIKYSGIPYRVEIRYHNASGFGQLLLSWLHFSDNGYAGLGDSISEWTHYGACEQSTTQQTLNSARAFPFVGKFVGGIQMQPSGTADSLINHYAKRSYLQGYRRATVQIGVNDYQTTGSANQAALETALTTMLNDFSVNMEHVILCTLTPRGSPANRDSATQAAVAHTNAFLVTQAASLNGAGPCVFDVCDVHYDLTNNGTTGDGYPDNVNWSTDGVHPDRAFQRMVRGIAGYAQQRLLGV